MCGIFAVLSKKNQRLNSKKCFDALNELYNRGPDIAKYKFFLNSRLFISNSILSITGKPSKNSELFESQSKNYSISFNGEIYNFNDLKEKFLKLNNIKSEELTDTEILVNLHDVVKDSKIPKLLNGMFSYVVFDEKNKKILISNDVQGEKNLYYYEDENYFIVSSIPKSIIKFIKNINLDINSLKSYFSTRHYMPLEKTCYEKISLFKNGTFAIYNIKNKTFKKKIYDNPENWIDEREYNYYEKLKKNDLIYLFEDKLLNQAKLMIPNKKFGSIVSGGIDSSLQTAIISKIKNPDINLSINHKHKDKIIFKNKYSFEKYLNNEVLIFDSDNNLYSRNALKVYDIISSPMQTHDLPSRMQLSKEFKSKGCKVFFSADGCDELFGGQQIYLKTFKDNKSRNLNYNNSPYSNYGLSEIEFNSPYDDERRNLFNDKWINVFQKYNFLRKKDQNIQSSLFLDYFMQSTNVANRSNDLICCNFSIEPRNIFIQKDILKMVVNLPLKYKYNYDEKDKKFIQKNILKKLFAKYFDKGLIKAKEGFSGYPNHLKKKLTNNDFKYVKDFLEVKNIKSRITKSLEWKLINLEIFLEKYVKNEY